MPCYDFSQEACREIAVNLSVTLSSSSPALAEPLVILVLLLVKPSVYRLSLSVKPPVSATHVPNRMLSINEARVGATSLWWA
jgi:hypothetical protein